MPATASASPTFVSLTSHTDRSRSSADNDEVDPGTSVRSVFLPTHRAAAEHIAHESSYTMHDGFSA